MGFLAGLIPSRWLIEGLIGIACAVGITIAGHSFLEHERDLGRHEVQARWDEQKKLDQAAALKQERDWRTKYDDAIHQGAEHAQASRLAAAAANAAADSLRNTSDRFSRLLPSATADAARQYAAAYQAVFTDCVGRYKALGERADGHALDAATLSAAWPVSHAEKPAP